MSFDRRRPYKRLRRQRNMRRLRSYRRLGDPRYYPRRTKHPVKEEFEDTPFWLIVLLALPLCIIGLALGYVMDKLPVPPSENPLEFAGLFLAFLSVGFLVMVFWFYAMFTSRFERLADLLLGIVMIPATILSFAVALPTMGLSLFFFGFPASILTPELFWSAFGNGKPVCRF